MSFTHLPFFGQPLTQIKGLDPLRLQVPAIAAYQRLLPGLNNVTARIRAYSFYCWLLQAYAKRVKLDDPHEQRRFIRGAEWLVALLAAAHEEVGSAAGINKASLTVSECNKEENPYPVERMIFAKDGTTTGTFWKNRGGVLAQYYRSTLLNLGLLKVVPVGPNGKGKLYVVSDPADGVAISGSQLADAFAESIGPESSRHFLDLIKRKAVEPTELLALFPSFDLARIPVGQERELLLALLSGPDDPRETDSEAGPPPHNRLDSLHHLLSFYAEHPEARGDYRAFTAYALSMRGRAEDDLPNHCLTGWYYYRLNEEFQYACTSIFSWLLQRMTNEGGGWVALEDFTDQAVAATVEELSTSGINAQTVAELSAAVAPGAENYLTEPDAMAQLQRLFWRQRTHQDLSSVEEFANKLRGRAGIGYRDVLDFFREVNDKKEEPLKEFLHRFYQRHILLRHRRVALEKLQIQRLSSEKFILEGGMMRFIMGYEATETGPRLGAATGFLVDLGLLVSDSDTDTVTVTPAGINWLKNPTAWN